MMYVGSALDPPGRWSRHRCDLKRGRHHSPILQNCWNKYGAESFAYELIEKVEKPEDLTTAEQRHLDLAFATGRCMNVERIACSSLGRKHSQETLAKLLGHPVSEETKAKISAAHKGRVMSPEAREAISRALKGRSVSEETRLKVSALKRGCTVSPEARRKISEANKGRKRSPEARQRMSDSRKGVPKSPEHRAAMREANRSWTDEQAYDLVFVKGLNFKEAAKILGASRGGVAEAARREKNRRNG